MNPYLRHIQTKTPHERRQHATQIAFISTGAIAVVWILTLGFRLPANTAVTPTADSTNQSQTASATYGLPSSASTNAGASLQVATSSVLAPQQ